MKLHTIGLLAFIILTSCMGESGEWETYGSQVGIVQINGSEKLIELRSGNLITSDDFQNQAVEQDDCCLVDFRINHSEQPRRDEGVYLVDIVQYESVQEWPLLNEVDTISVHRDESFLDFEIDASLYVNGHLFIFPEYRRHYYAQEDSFWMSYDPSLPLITDELTGSQGFELYLRSTSWRTSSDTASIRSAVLTEAFHIQDFIDRALASGKISGDSLNFRLVYPEYFLDSDSSSYGWRTSDMYTIELDKDLNTW